LKALVYRRYGPPDVLRVEDVQKPVPKDDEVLVRVHASSINAADRVLLHGRPLIIRLTGTITPVIERTCSLSEVPDALRRLENDHARGKTVIAV
jgi:NADPH:quinone reductase-like Zn-dependent oxidoreductase